MIVLGALILLFGYILISSFVDFRRKREVREHPAISFVIPCYNGGDTIAETVRSVYHAYRDHPFELVIIDDASDDRTREVLEKLGQRYPFRLVHNALNRGKAQSLNDCFEKTTYDLLLFLDADVIVNRKALRDVIARFQKNPRLGAVSCPFAPKNHGFLPLMQKIEYIMKALVQGSYNLFSAMSLWGGCLAVRKAALIEVEGFSTNAIVEDVDLAFKLNEQGWKVEQSFLPVRTYVPDDPRAWYRQKKRWVSGSLQCLIKYRHIWIKNPVQVLMMLIYTSFIVSSIYSLTTGAMGLDNLLDAFHRTGGTHDVSAVLKFAAGYLDGKFCFLLLSRLLFSFFSIPYVIPLIQRPDQLYKLFYVIPFTMLYYPALFLVSIVGIVFCLLRYRSLAKGSRAW